MGSFPPQPLAMEIGSAWDLLLEAATVGSSAVSPPCGMDGAAKVKT